MGAVGEVWFERVEGDAAPARAYADRLRAAGGGPVDLATAITGLHRHAHRAPAPGLRAWWGLTWDHVDRRDRRWWPQGVSTAADAGPEPPRELMLVSWYARPRPGDPDGGQGSRLSILDLPTRRYRHVLLVRVDEDGVHPLRVHAGGIVWRGRWVHIGATGRGFVTADLADLLAVPAGPERDRVFGYDLVLPVRTTYRSRSEEGTDPLRCSFLSLHREQADGHEGTGLVVGEYGRRDASTRLATLPLDADGLPRAGAGGRVPVRVRGDGPRGMQGAVLLRGHWHVSTSHAEVTPGSVWSGRPGAWRQRTLALPMGPEDLSLWPGRRPDEDRVWTVTEHPWRRWVVPFRPARLE